MSDDVQTASAQPDTPAPVLTATEQAVVANDYAAFEAAERAPKSGPAAPAQPAAEPPTETAPAAPAPPVEEPKAVSKRQQQINDYERSIAELKAENARLRTPATPPAPRSEPRPEPAAPLTLADTIARPDVRQAPISEAQFYTDHPDAGTGDYADYRASYRYAYNKLADARHSAEQDGQRIEQARVATARASLEAATQADPTFPAKIAPLLQSLQTREQARADGVRPGPEHDFGSALVRSAVAATILAHLADHPEVLETVKALDSRADVLTFFGRLEAKFLDTPSPAAVVPPSLKTVSSAPPPAASLGTRPVTPADPMRAAVAGDDYLAFERLEREKLVPIGRR